MTILFDTLLTTFDTYSVIFIALAPVVAGEAGILLLAFVHSNAASMLVIVGVWSFVAMAAMDIFWFLVPRSQWLRRHVGVRISRKPTLQIKERIDAFTHGREILVLAFAKLLVGTRTAFVMYMGTQPLRLSRFAIMAIIVNALWSAILVLVGYFARSSFDYTFHVLQNVQFAVFVLLVIVVFCYWAYRRVKKSFLYR